jgi:signal transduction histidine kinase
LPYVVQEGRLVAVFFLYVCAMVNTVGSIRHAPATGRDALSPLVIPISTVPFILIYLDYMKLGMAVMFACSTIALFAFRRATQDLLNTAYYARLEAERERDAKDRFIASASHDLQQPIQAAGLSFDQVLSLKGAARDKAARRVRWALDTTGQLLVRMIEHLQLEAGQVTAKKNVFPIGPSIAKTAELYEPSAAASGVQIHAMPSRLAVIGDAALIDRILANFVTNAIKHAEASRLLIGARYHAGKVRIWVIDDGVGITDSDKGQLFEDYFQGSDHGDQMRGGFGLGLASARRMAQLMGGSAGLDNRMNRGAAFWFELPAA